MERFAGFIPGATTAAAGAGAQSWAAPKWAPAFRKTHLSTPRARLYYYDYVFIETLRRRQGKTLATPVTLAGRGGRA